ncbi:hypothetical protein D9M71_104870 [compost metagenome]
MHALQDFPGDGVGVVEDPLCILRQLLTVLGQLLALPLKLLGEHLVLRPTRITLGQHVVPQLRERRRGGGLLGRQGIRLALLGRGERRILCCPRLHLGQQVRRKLRQGQSCRRLLVRQRRGLPLQLVCQALVLRHARLHLGQLVSRDIRHGLGQLDLLPHQVLCGHGFGIGNGGQLRCLLALQVQQFCGLIEQPRIDYR